MFTGLVEEIGTVASLALRTGGAVLEVETTLPLAEVAEGDSIAVSGACLTVTARSRGRFHADVSAETLDRTAVGSLRAGSKVNLERAMKASGRLDGHLVYGHVDGVARVAEVRPVGEGRVFHLRADASIMNYIVFKGAVAVDGVSLTVSAVGGDGFEVALIPMTLSKTTFGAMRPGDAVNVEADIVGKYVLRFLERKQERDLSLDFLRKHGFA